MAEEVLNSVFTYTKVAHTPIATVLLRTVLSSVVVFLERAMVVVVPSALLDPTQAWKHNGSDKGS